MHQAVADGNVARLRDLLATGDVKHEPNMFDWGGKTPLHWAALNGEAEMAELLLGHGAIPDSKDRLGRTPLHCAALCGAVDCTQVSFPHAHTHIHTHTCSTHTHAAPCTYTTHT